MSYLNIIRAAQSLWLASIYVYMLLHNNSVLGILGCSISFGVQKRGPEEQSFEWKHLTYPSQPPPPPDSADPPTKTDPIPPTYQDQYHPTNPPPPPPPPPPHTHTHEDMSLSECNFTSENQLPHSQPEKQVNDLGSNPLTLEVTELAQKL